MCRECDFNGPERIAGVDVLTYRKYVDEGVSWDLSLCPELQADLLFLLRKFNQAPDGWLRADRLVAENIWAELHLDFRYKLGMSEYIFEKFIDVATALLYQAVEWNAFLEIQTSDRTRWIWDNNVVAEFFRSPDAVLSWMESKQGAPSTRDGPLLPTRSQRSHTIQAGASSVGKLQSMWGPNAPVTPQKPQSSRTGHRTFASLGGGVTSSPTFPWGASPIQSPRTTASKHKRNTSALEDFTVGREMVLNDLKNSTPNFRTQSLVTSTPRTPRFTSTPHTPRFANQMIQSPQSSPSAQRQTSRPIESPKAPCTPWFSALSPPGGSGSTLANLKQDDAFKVSPGDTESIKLDLASPAVRSLIDRISRMDVQETTAFHDDLDTNNTVRTQAVYAEPYSLRNMPKLQLPQPPKKQGSQVNDNIGTQNPTSPTTPTKPCEQATRFASPSLQPLSHDEQEREQYTYLNSVLSQAPAASRHGTPATVIDSSQKTLETENRMTDTHDQATPSTGLLPIMHARGAAPTGFPSPDETGTSTGPIIRLSPSLVRWLATNTAGTCEQDLSDWDFELRYALKRVEEDRKALVRRGKQPANGLIPPQ